jgi:DNA-binding winged helix-turn-helix (wHTH) protein/TolB-like protein/Tfp pilus assembly protein PilF
MGLQIKSFEFGPFHLEPRERLLLRDGQAIQLAPKVFETLVVLVEQRGRIVEKDELMKRVWPDTFVDESSLTRNISVLRKALGEDATGSRYIETVPKLGYRFRADVSVSGDEQADLIVEKRTFSQTITIEDETDETDIEPVSVQKALAAGSGTNTGSEINKGPLWEARPVALVALALLVGMAGLFLYFWISSKPSRPAGVADIKTVAVIPFKILGAEPDDQHLGLGMADTLITRLSNLKEIVVRPTSAVLRYNVADQDPVVAGRALQVEAVLEGSIQRVDDRIRVTVRLMSVQDGSPLWANKFDEKLTDILAVQDSISEQVVRTLALNLSGDERKLLTKRYTASVEAYQAYLKGRYFWNKRTGENYEKAIEYFEQAIGIDSNYALAHTGLADAYSLLANSPGSNQEREERYQKAKAAALKALNIDETLAEAHTSLGWIRRNYGWDWPGAEREFKRAIELNPNSADAHQWYALLLTTLGRMDEAIAESKRARELDPLTPIVSVNAGSVLFHARQFDRAIAHFQEALELDANFFPARHGLVMAYVQKRMSDEAIAKIQQILPSYKDSVILQALLARAYIWTGQRDKVQEALDYLHEQAKRRSDAFYHLATVYSDLGEKDKAFESLQQAYEGHDDRLLWIKVDPRLDNLRSDSRFQDLLRRMGLKE